jgi:hypothetical protein
VETFKGWFVFFFFFFFFFLMKDGNREKKTEEYGRTIFQKYEGRKFMRKKNKVAVAKFKKYMRMENFC